MDIQPGDLARAVRDSLRASTTDVNAYWLQVDGNRDNYAAKLRAELENDPVAILIVRDVGFDNQNSVLADLVKIMNKNRAACEQAASRANGMRFGVLLLARTALSVAQTSSMVTMPRWLPKLGGQYVAIVIEDLTWTADAPLNCGQAKIEELQERLYELEGAILQRLIAAYEANRQCANHLLPIIRRGDSERYPQLLEMFRLARAEPVNSPRTFRPSRREGRSLVGRLWDLAQRRAPEDVHGLARALATAMGLTDEQVVPIRESFVSVLRRPANRHSSPAYQFTADMLVTVAAGCQFVTAAVHSVEYPNYPIPLLVSFSYHLRRALLDAEMALGRVP